MKRTREKSGLTLVEILTVLAIISLLAGILIPAVTAVKTAAKETKQKGQFMTIELGLTTFKDPSVYGDYPPSTYTWPAWPGPPTRSTPGGIYCGAQRLSEALLGWDLLGFHPNSGWWWDGWDKTETAYVYDPAADLSARKGPYLESGTKNAFTLADLFPSHPLATEPGADRYVICDVFGATKVTLGDGTVVKAGAPILYYKADPSGTTIYEVYDADDNLTIVGMKQAEDKKGHPLIDSSFFYEYIRDKKIDPTVRIWPYRPYSYILISAGADGIYGTGDDIRNFGY